MFRRIWEFLKARWVWGQGRCPSCNRPYYRRPAPHNGACPVCRGETDDLSIWCNYRRRLRKPMNVHSVQPAA
jgi:hypothetical protein